MTVKERKAVIERIFEVLRESGLSAADQIRVLIEARNQCGPNPDKRVVKKSFKPLLRPGGNMMGKERRQPKEKD